MREEYNINELNPRKNPYKRYTTIELFAGAGGLALGIERAGFETLVLIMGFLTKADKVVLGYICLQHE